MLRWKTYNHIQHPFGDLIWHLFWGIITGISIFSAIVNYDYWLLIISVISIFFFFHPKFYEPHIIDIRVDEKGIFIDNNFYPWSNFHSFEIFENGLRKFIFLFPNRISLGVHFPLEEFFVSEEEIRKFFSKYLEESKGKVPILDKIYRSFYL